MFNYEIGNVGSEKKALAIRARLQGKSYMNFQVYYGAACAGNYPVSVMSDYDGDREEMLGMLIFLLATGL